MLTKNDAAAKNFLKSQKPITLVTTSLQIADNVNTTDNQAF